MGSNTNADLSPYIEVDSNGDVYLSEWQDQSDLYGIHNVEHEEEYSLDTHLAYIINQQNYNNNNNNQTGYNYHPTYRPSNLIMDSRTRLASKSKINSGKPVK